MSSPVKKLADVRITSLWTDTKEKDFVCCSYFSCVAHKKNYCNQGTDTSTSHLQASQTEKGVTQMDKQINK